MRPGILDRLGIRPKDVLHSPVGVDESGWALYVALHCRPNPGEIHLLVMLNSNAALRVSEELETYLGPDRVRYYPQLESLPFERVSPSQELIGQRVKVLRELESHDSVTEGMVVVTTIRAFMQRLSLVPSQMSTVSLAVGSLLDVDDLADKLVSMGYVREYIVEAKGQFAIRGSIVDIYPPAFDLPVRVDLFGEEVEGVYDYDPDDQRRLGSHSEVEVLPAREVSIGEHTKALAKEAARTWSFGRDSFERIARGEYFDGVESWLQWLDVKELSLATVLGPKDKIILFEPSRLRARSLDLIDEETVLKRALAESWGIEDVEQMPSFHIPVDSVLETSQSELMIVEPSASHAKVVETWGLSGRESEHLINKIKTLIRQGYLVVVGAETVGSATSIVTSFREHLLDAVLVEDPLVVSKVTRNYIQVVPEAPLHEGAISNVTKLAVISESDLSGRRRSHRSRSTSTKVRSVRVDFEALEIGSYVVHDTHGVAIYQGMTKRTLAGAERDYLLLEFKGSDKIYVPTEQVSLITPYMGGERPALSRLGGSDWQVTKAKARKAAQEIAQELVVLYQKRIVSDGHAFAGDTPWQVEIEDRFPYELTRDQLRAIMDVKQDMESPKPMDRLVCGDVGFGKTEIAIRAAYKAVQDSKQVAVLVPTTLLAQQHYQTFSDRFEGQPVNVAMLSRFLTAKESKDVIQGITDGSIDVVIGTHRLLAKDLRFKDLGLLVVDEEQRFGVSHKEQIKQLKVGVDVLTLTATPIPRTLEMSLTGIRDLSLLRTPPKRRQPILTHVGPYDTLAVSEAIRRELIREGQVFFVHNRVRDIEVVAQKLRELVPEARVAVAHGQMDESLLEQVIIDFWEGLYDVLVCTTIIESGIDMPTVNTLVVDRADLLGLGQLHQIRGRVGRSGLRAYAYLFYPESDQISDVAYERLKTISENVELGSGYRIAMRDLEIRGAGNLLGENQSGHMAAVGYDLYVRMVKEAVAELNGMPVEKVVSLPSVDVPLDVYIPESYVDRADLRLDLYSRFARVTSLQDVDDLEAELLDRFGEAPVVVKNLVGLVRLQVRLLAVGVRELSVTKKIGALGFELKVSPVELPRSRSVRLKRLYARALVKDNLKEIVVPLESKIVSLDTIERFCREILFSDSK